jgi:AAA domain/Primase C terminal 1 (PriCT-1)/Bifunctional DNA primase/polymerase, N-terminal
MAEAVVVDGGALYDMAIAAGFIDALVTAHGEKHPLTPWRRFQDRHLTDEERAEQRALAVRTPSPGFWSPTGGPHGMLALDADDEQARVFLSETLGEDVFASTAWERTPHGHHLIFAVDKDDRTPNNGPEGVGIASLHRRGYGGGIKHWPSGGYDLVRSPAQGLLPLPDALRDPLAEPSGGGGHAPSDPQASATIPRGERNTTLLSLGGTMRYRGLQKDEILAALLVVNARRCDPPLDEEEVRRIAASLASYEPATPGGFQAGKAVLTCLADVEPEEVVFLWQRRLVQGKLNLIFGEPGLGKSYLTLYCAANVSRGLPWPDGGAPPVGTVILLTAEDGLADTIRPRLDKLGADPTRIHALTAVKRSADGQEATFSLLDDLAILEATVVRLGASFVIIDPLNAYLAKVDSHRASEVRSALAPIAAMAERTHVTFLAVHHTNKSGDGRALNRVTGSGDFAAAPRSVLLVAPDPDDESRRCLVSAKLNLARKPPGLGFSIIEGGLVFDDEPVTQDANALLASSPRSAKDEGKFEEAKEWLAEYLGDYQEHPQKEVKAAAKAAGIADRTLWRAKDALQVRSEKGGMTAGWTWRLPSPIAEVRIHSKVINGRLYKGT